MLHNFCGPYQFIVWFSDDLFDYDVNYVSPSFQNLGRYKMTYTGVKDRKENQPDSTFGSQLSKIPTEDFFG